MTDNEARQLVGLLVAGTSGWTDESVDLYVTELSCLARFDIGLSAVRGVLHTYSKPGRPPLAVILDAYRREMDRAPKDHIPALRGAFTPASEGMLLAWRAYVDECRKTGKEPNRSLFGSVVSNISSD